MRKNAEKMDLSSRNRLLRVPAGSHGFWAHDPLPDPSHDPDVDPQRVTIPLAFTILNVPHDSKLRFLRYEETFLLYPRFWWWMGSVTPFFPNVWEHFDVTNSKDQF